MTKNNRKLIWPALTNYVKAKKGKGFKEQILIVNQRVEDFPGETMSYDQMKQARIGNVVPHQQWIDALIRYIRTEGDPKFTLEELDVDTLPDYEHMQEEAARWRDKYYGLLERHVRVLESFNHKLQNSRSCGRPAPMDPTLPF